MTFRSDLPLFSMSADSPAKRKKGLYVKDLLNMSRHRLNIEQKKAFFGLLDYQSYTRLNKPQRHTEKDNDIRQGKRADCVTYRPYMTYRKGKKIKYLTRPSKTVLDRIEVEKKGLNIEAKAKADKQKAIAEF